jgi:AcrR family transcriptional regulator
MTGAQRRQQLLHVGRELFAQRGCEATAIEEIATHADVSKPVVYEHFGGEDGLYAVVVEREMQRLLLPDPRRLGSGPGSGPGTGGCLLSPRAARRGPARAPRAGCGTAPSRPARPPA